MRNREQRPKRKGQESTIGKIIYGFLLFAPLIAILTGCLISTFNIATKEETEIHYRYETNEVNSNDDLIVGNIYRFTTDDYFISTNSSEFGLLFLSLEDCNFDEGDNVFSEIYFSDINHNYNGVIGYFSSSTIDFYQGYDAYVSYSITQQMLKLSSIVIIETLDNLNNNFYQNFTKLENQYIPIDYVETHNVSAEDVFYRSVDKVVQSPLFNWATNSIIYTTTASTCNALSITTPFVPLLLSYWLIISVIYYLYDIALMLVWILHRKIHELQESI